MRDPVVAGEINPQTNSTVSDDNVDKHPTSYSQPLPKEEGSMTPISKTRQTQDLKTGVVKT